MAQIVSDVLLHRLHASGVERIFGCRGDGINGIMGAFGRLDGAIDCVQTRYEQICAFMPCEWWAGVVPQTAERE
jgi:pyruvate dehydrogenase (quinone)